MAEKGEDGTSKEESRWKGDPFDEIPDMSPERLEELEKRRLHAVEAERKGESIDAPYGGVKLNLPEFVYLLGKHENNRGGVNIDLAEEQNRKGLDLREVVMHEVDLSDRPLDRTNFAYADLEGSEFDGSMIRESNLEGVILEDAVLMRASLRNSDLYRVNLKNANLKECDLSGADLCDVTFSDTTILDSVMLSDEKYGTVSTCDLHWNDANLAVIKDITSQLKVLGDEKKAQDFEKQQPKVGDKGLLQGIHSGIISFVPATVESIRATIAYNFSRAVRANRQLAVALRNQGLNEAALHFSYKANQLQRKVYKYEDKRSRQFVSWILDIFAGYGYKPERALLAYFLTVVLFGFIFYFTSPIRVQLTLLDSLVLSLSNSLRIGFLPNTATLGDLLTTLSVVEGAVAIFIEAILLASFLRRFLEE